MKITKIEIQKNNKNRVNLFVDDNFFCGLSLETIVKNHIKENQEISNFNP
jgi:regulatory protein